MKKTILLFATMIFIISCSESPEEIKENINDKYLNQAQIFIQSKVDQSNKDQDVTIDSFENLKIDTVVVLSSQMVERTKMQSLWNKYDLEKEYLDKLVEIDKSFGVQPDKMTTASRDKCRAIIDSLERWENRIKILPKNDTLGYSVQYSYDLKQSDGVSLKKRSYIIHFDKNHDINGDWNK